MSFHRPRKRFGQHFLTDEQVIAQIIRALHVQRQDKLIEIGAGLGALTTGVLAQVDHLHVVEIDRDLSAQLQKTFPSRRLTVHQQDALAFDFSSLYENQPLRIFGNLPYNISTPLLFHLLTYAPCIQDMLFMLQKEVVMRMIATPSHHEYGRLSVMIQYACHTQALFDIAPQAFSPPPQSELQCDRFKTLPSQSSSSLSERFPCLCAFGQRGVSTPA